MKSISDTLAGGHNHNQLYVDCNYKSKPIANAIVVWFVIVVVVVTSRFKLMPLIIAIVITIAWH